MFISKLWSDCEGGILTTELVLVASFVTATLLAGLGTMRNQMTSEFQDLSTTIKRAKVVQMLPANVDQINRNAVIVRGTQIEGGIDGFTE